VKETKKLKPNQTKEVKQWWNDTSVRPNVTKRLTRIRFLLQKHRKRLSLREEMVASRMNHGQLISADDEQVSCYGDFVRSHCCVRE